MVLRISSGYIILSLILFILSTFCCKLSLSVTTTDDDDIAVFTCYSSNECHGNEIPGIGKIENCCTASGGGLSYIAASGLCANCYDQQTFASEGSQFYLGIFDNHHPEGPFEIDRLRIAVDPLENNATSYSIEVLGESTVYTGSQEIYIKASDIQLNSPKSRESGIHIMSLDDAPLSVVAYSEEFVSSDSFKVLPCIRQPNNYYEYYAISVVQADIEFQVGVGPTFSLPPEGKSAIVIVSTEDDTVLHITLTQDVFIGDANDLMEEIGADTLLAGQTVNITLQKAMQTLYLASNDDLTGSRIVSNRPISFTSGHECGTLPNTMLYCDQMVDQIPPTATWGTTFIVASLLTRDSDSIKIVASRSNTTITVLCSQGSGENLYIESAGGFTETLILSGVSCYFESDNPVLLVQFSRSSLSDDVINSDPFMVIIPPVDQYRSDYVIRTFDTSDPNSPAGQHYVNILIPGAYNPSQVRLDGEPLMETPFEFVYCEDGETVCAYTYQTDIFEAGQVHTLSHEDPAARINAVVYWYSFRVGQGYFAGMMQQPIALPTVTVEAVNDFANESEGMAQFRLIRSGDVSLESTVVFETTNVQPPPNPATAGEDFEGFSMVVFFSPGETEVMVSVPLIDDVFPEQEFEHFEVALSSSPGVLIGSPSFVNFTIMDDDPPVPVVNVSVESLTLSTSELAGTVQINLLKTQNAIGPVSVMVVTSDGTAQIEDSDYVLVSEIVTFTTEETTKSVTITINADRKIEDPENFAVMVTALNGLDYPFPVRVNPNEGTATVTIQDEEVAVVGFVEPIYGSYEGGESFSVSVEVILGGRELQKTISVVVSSEDRNAFAGDDYEHVNSILTFMPGTTRLAFDVIIIDDSLIESSESFSLRLFPSEEESSVVFSPAVTVVTISDNDRGVISLEPLRPLVREGDGNARVTVSLRGASFQSEKGAGAVVSVTTSSMTAVMGEDFEAPFSSTVILFQEDAVEEVLIPITDDQLFEGATNETFNVRISLPSCPAPGMLTIENAESIVSIEDNDVRPVARVRFASGSVSPSGVEGTQLNLLVEGDGQNQQPVTVQYNVLRTGTAQIGIDVSIETAGTLTLPAGGGATAAIPVSLIDDSFAEAPEFFLVRISASNNQGEVLSAFDTANITIIDNDRVLFGFETTRYSVMESDGVLEVDVLKLTETTEESFVTFSTQNILLVSFSANQTISDTTEQFVFQPSEVRRTVSIPLLDDQIAGEALEVFNLLLTVAPGQSVDTAVQDGLAQVLVFDNDEFGEFFIQPAFTTVSESTGEVSVMIIRDESTTGNNVPVTLTVTTRSGTALGGADFVPLSESVTFQPGDILRTVTVEILEDNIEEDIEFFTISAAYLLNTATGGVQNIEIQAQVLIESDAPPPQIGFSQASYSVAEGTRLVVLEITTSDPSVFTDSNGTLFYTVAGSAVDVEDQSDFTGISLANAVPIIFPAGETVTTVSVPISDDLIVETTEQFFGRILSGGGIPNIMITRQTTIVNITDNDEYIIGWRNAVTIVSEGSETVQLSLLVRSETLLQNSAIFSVNTVPGEAQGGMVDYRDHSEDVIFTSSIAEATVDIFITDDDIIEPEECFTVVAVPQSDGRNLRAVPNVATVCIQDNDFQSGSATIGFSESDYRVMEGGDFSNVCIVVVALSGQFDEEATLGILSTTGRDFSETAVVNFTGVEVGDALFCSSIAIDEDNVAELDQVFNVSGFIIEGPQYLTLSPGGNMTSVTVIDNDEVIVGWQQTSYMVVEGSESLQICLVIQNEVTLSSSARITVFDSETGSTGAAQAGVDYVALSQELVLESGSTTLCTSVSIIDDSVASEGIECFNVISESVDTRILIRVPSTSVCIMDNDFESVTAQCLFDQSTATTIISANCSTSEVAPDTVIQFVMCQIDGVDTDVCSYPTFTINTDDYQPGQHTLAISLQVGNGIIRLSPDYTFEGTAEPISPTPPPVPITDPFREPFSVGCSISTDLTTASVFCAATVSSSRVNIDSCVLDSDPNALIELCAFPSFTFPLTNLEPGDHTLEITFSDTNAPDSIEVETLMFTSTVAMP